jgi:hypothetical protein
MTQPLRFTSASRAHKSKVLPIEIAWDVETPSDLPDGDPTTIELVETFEIDLPLPALPIIDHALLQAEGAGADARYLSIGQVLKSVIRPVDWPRFRAATTAAKFDIDELTVIAQGILDGAAGRPTGPPSDSAGTQSSGGTSSNGDTAPPAAADPFSTEPPDSPTS